jgi:hypothetical protein
MAKARQTQRGRCAGLPVEVLVEHELKSFAEDYRYGAGVYFDVGKHAPLGVPVSEA